MDLVNEFLNCHLDFHCYVFMGKKKNVTSLLNKTQSIVIFKISTVNI